MKKQFVKTTTALLIACAVLIATAISLAVFGGLSATAEFTTDKPLAERYYVGETLEIPAGTFSDGTRAQNVIVTYPDGARKKTDRITFSDAGRYVIEYSATVGEDIISKKKTVLACERKFAVDKATVSARYMENVPFKAGAGITETANGIYAELAEGTNFVYNKVFDLTDKTKDDIVFSANIIASADGYADFWDLTVRFTDVYDESNYIDAVLWHSGNADHAIDLKNDTTNFMRAGVSGQPTVAKNWNENGIVQVDKYGKWVDVTMMNSDRNENNFGSTLDISFDYAEKKIYGPNRRYQYSDRAIIDLGSVEYFEKPWKGFTTGECTVSVFAGRFQKSKGAVFVRKIFSDASSAFRDNYLVDETKPTVSVDFDGYSESDLPFAVVGKPYKLFSATANDALGKVKNVETRVYFNYGSAAPISVTVSDGKFVPSAAGAYTAVYTCEDYFGNVGKREVFINCSAPSEFSASLESGYPTVGETGTETEIARVEVSGASGKVDTKVSAKCSGAVYEIDYEKGKFRPEQDGTYTVTYKMTDRAGREKELSYDLEIQAGNAPVFISDVSLPMYFVAGYEQILPSLDAVDYKDGAKKVASEIWVKEGDAAERKLTDGKLTPAAIGAPYELKVIYKATGKYGTGEKKYSVDCYSVFKGGVAGQIDKSALFVADSGVTAGFATAIASDSSEYATYSATSDGGITYINPLPANNFSLNFVIPANANDFSSVLFTLAAPDGSERLEIVFAKGESNALMFGVNGSPLKTLSGYSFGSDDRRITFSYSDLTRTVSTDNGNVTTVVSAGADGGEFKGFESGKVYLHAEFVGVTGSAKIAVQRICNQSLANSTRDNGDPMLVLNGEYGKRFSKGATVSLFGAVCLDMIDPSVTATLTVRSPSGAMVTDADGVVLDKADAEKSYRITLSEYGAYVLEYKYDGLSLDYRLNVVDEEPPVITVSTDMTASYKVGQTVTFSATATDNATAETIVYVRVIDVTGKAELLSGDYTFSAAGKYKVIFFAYDERGNLGQMIYDLTVGE